MKHLRHQSRKKELYEGDLVIHSGLLGDFWGGKGAKGEGQKRSGDQLARPGKCKDGARIVQGGSRETSSRGRKEI